MSVVCYRREGRAVAEEAEDPDAATRLIGRDGMGSHCCSCGYGGEVEGVDELLKLA